jgi:hypothetical protein
MTRHLPVIAAALLWLAPAGLAAQEPQAAARPARRHAVEFSPASPLIRIYAVQFARRVTERDEILVGGAYTNIKYDFGRSHAPTAIIGYRRYVWRHVHLEYQLWPSYNWFYETNERRYYNGPELWNEFRPGYTFDFRMGETPAFVNVQYLIGFGLYGGNKPQSFKDKASDEPVFTAPMVFVGWRF